MLTRLPTSSSDHSAKKLTKVRKVTELGASNPHMSSCHKSNSIFLAKPNIFPRPHLSYYMNPQNFNLQLGFPRSFPSFSSLFGMAFNGPEIKIEFPNGLQTHLCTWYLPGKFRGGKLRHNEGPARPVHLQVNEFPVKFELGSTLHPGFQWQMKA